MPNYFMPEVNGLPRRRSGRSCRRKIVVVAIPDVLPLEIIGPVDAFTEANAMLEHIGREDLGYDIEVVGFHKGTVYEKHGFRLVVEKSYDEIRGKIDTLMVQAVDGEECSLRDRGFLAWIRRQAPRVRRLASVCAGTYILAETGLLNGRRATTHWCAADDFQARYPEVALDTDPIYIKDGNIYTSAGVTSGIDLTLAMIEEDYGQDLALKVAQGLVLFLRRPGNQAQFSTHMKGRFPEETRIREVQGYIADNLGKDLRVERLAERAGMSPRNFARVFAAEVGLAPGKFVEESRLELARHCLERTELTISQVADHCGYGTTDAMRLAFDRRLGVSPREYRSRFATASRSEASEKPGASPRPTKRRPSRECTTNRVN